MRCVRLRDTKKSISSSLNLPMAAEALHILMRGWHRNELGRDPHSSFGARNAFFAPGLSTNRMNFFDSSCRSHLCLVLVQASWTAGARFLISGVRLSCENIGSLDVVNCQSFQPRSTARGSVSSAIRLPCESSFKRCQLFFLYLWVISCFLILMNHLKFKGFQMSKWLEGLVVVAPTPSLKSRSVHRSEANIKDWKSFESLEYVWMIW